MDDRCDSTFRAVWDLVSTLLVAVAAIGGFIAITHPNPHTPYWLAASVCLIVVAAGGGDLLRPVVLLACTLWRGARGKREADRG